jgi:nucleoside-diphosphate-sugar epimerase
LGHPTRDTNFVGNFLDGLELALRAGATGTYNIASGREVSILDLAKSVIQATGTGAILRSDEFQYRAGEAGVRTWLDVSKGHDAFGYSPKVSLEDGLRPTVEWYRLHRDYFHKTQEPGPIATTQ